MGRFSRCPYLSSVAVAFVAVTMPSFSVTSISVTVTLSTRRPVTIPAKRTEPRDAHIMGQNRKNAGDFTTFHNLTYRDVLGICTVLCPSICESRDQNKNLEISLPFMILTIAMFSGSVPISVPRSERGSRLN